MEVKSLLLKWIKNVLFMMAIMISVGLLSLSDRKTIVTGI